jgi:hypothetical protein
MHWRIPDCSPHHFAQFKPNVSANQGSERTKYVGNKSLFFFLGTNEGLMFGPVRFVTRFITSL